jgi:hypothetical protein
MPRCVVKTGKRFFFVYVVANQTVGKQCKMSLSCSPTSVSGSRLLLPLKSEDECEGQQLVVHGRGGRINEGLR